jgi:hypothetical protein
MSPKKPSVTGFKLILNLNFFTMKKANLLSKAEMKLVKGGGLPPETPGGNETYCQARFKGHVLCISDHGMGTTTEYFYACCSTLADAGAFCPAGSLYTCTGFVAEEV